LLDDDEAELLLIDRRNYFVFSPLLIEAGTGGVEPRHAVVSIRRFLHDQGDFLMGEVTGIDTDHQTVHYRLAGEGLNASVRYDHLVIALGSVTKMPPVDGLREHGFQMKRMADAIGMRDRVIQLLERANALDDPIRRRALLHLVVVGGNYTGVEFAGEFQEFMTSAARNYPNIRPEDCRITLVELTDHILPTLDPGLAEFAAEHLERRGVGLRLNNTIQRIAPDHADLKSGERLDTCTVIWCAGIAPSPLIERTNLPTDQLGYIRCDRDLRVSDFSNVWSVGDCAVNPGPDGKPYPPTAQHATRQGRFLADNLVRALRDEEAKPCDIRTVGMLAALGRRNAVANVMGWKVAGFPAWFLWRTIYLYLMPAWGRRLRVAADWTLNLLSRREYVQIGLWEQAQSTAEARAEAKAEQMIAGSERS